jgi:hypothetical protein
MNKAVFVGTMLGLTVTVLCCWSFYMLSTPRAFDEKYGNALVKAGVGIVKCIKTEMISKAGRLQD